MSTTDIPPDARLLWCLRRRASDIRCVLYPSAVRIEVQILQDRDVVLTEFFAEEWLALNWARAYGDRLRQQGWQEVPATLSADDLSGRSGQP